MYLIIIIYYTINAIHCIIYLFFQFLLFIRSLSIFIAFNNRDIYQSLSIFQFLINLYQSILDYEGNGDDDDGNNDDDDDDDDDGNDDE